MVRFLHVVLLLCFVTSGIWAESPKGWTKGKGWGWVWGPDDEVGSLNAIIGPEQVLRALKEVRQGKIYDLGAPYDRTSFKWPGHSPAEIMSFRSPQGVGRTKDIGGFAAGERNLGFHSCALFISDNVGTQIDGLGHITKGPDNHWYNGFREEQYGGDFGLLKTDADSIPPIIARAVLIDVAGWKGVDALPSNFPIGPTELQAALKAQQVDVEPGDVVLIRTGLMRFWGASGANHAKLAEHDSAGLTLAGAKWLVEQKGAVMIGADTSGLEVGSDPDLPGVAIAVHEYLLVDQGVHIGELHNLEQLAADRAYRFTYFAVTNRIRGATAGFTLRPLAIR
jgi:kynurenine formamidase